MLELLFMVLFALLTIGSVYASIKILRVLRRFRMTQLVSEPSMLKNLPSVSVCIPARNETAAMSQCLERVIASTYPKLEIIVLDDSSVDDTSYLIKSFAHAGVRFVEGSPLPEGWLGKNYALQSLLNEASGSLIFFMDVDTHIKPDTIEQLVSYINQQRASMVSVMPLRSDTLRTNTLLATMRYFWELLLHGKALPATASSAWLIRQQQLVDEFDGFNQVKTAIQPESVLASKLSIKDQYRFLISTPLIGVSYEKTWKDQTSTSIRLLFNVFGRGAKGTAIGLAVLLACNIPTFFVIDGFISGWSFVHMLAAWQLLLYIVLYAIYLQAILRRGWLIGALLWPYVVMQELVLFIASVYGYTFNKITWKGRPVTSSLSVKKS